MNTARNSLIVLAALLVAARGAHAFSFADVQYWVGSGNKQAMLVVDWNNGAASSSVAWGYRWSGTANGMDMLKAIAGSGLIRPAVGEEGSTTPLTGADRRFFLCLDTWWGGTGGAVFGMGYDANNNQSAFLPGVEGIETGHAADPADFYAEGWYMPNWNYSVGLCPGDVNRDGQVGLLDYNVIKANFGLASTNWVKGDVNRDGQVGLLDYNLVKANFGNVSPGDTSLVTWLDSPDGPAGRPLVNGDIDAWIYPGGGVGFIPHAPVAALPPSPPPGVSGGSGIVAIPEPVCLAALLMGGLLLPRRRPRGAQAMDNPPAGCLQ
ncbi:MAG: dockerin type I domain-containing protein [Planctomycetota bacterium]|nr:dockerin type I domain-containing protein [Planctomycetota bacterium]